MASHNIQDESDKECAKRRSARTVGMKMNRIAQSENTRHIVTEDSGHFLQYDDPQLFVEAVLELLLD